MPILGQHTVLLACINNSNCCKASGKNILPDLFCYSVKSTQWLIHKAQKTEVMSEVLPLTEGLAHFYKIHFKYKFMTGKQVSGTGAMFTPAVTVAQPLDLVFRSLVFLPELGSTHLQGWHHSRIKLM